MTVGVTVGMGVSVKVDIGVKTGRAVSVFATIVASFSSLGRVSDGVQAATSKSRSMNM